MRAAGRDVRAACVICRVQRDRSLFCWGEMLLVKVKQKVIRLLGLYCGRPSNSIYPLVKSKDPRLLTFLR